MELEPGIEDFVSSSLYNYCLFLELINLQNTFRMLKSITRRQYQSKITELLDRVKRRTKGKQRKLYIYSKKRKHIFPHIYIIHLLVGQRGSKVREIFHGMLAVGLSKQFNSSFIQFIRYPAFRTFTVGIHQFCISISHCRFHYKSLNSLPSIVYWVLYFHIVMS